MGERMDARKKKVLAVFALGSVILVWRMAVVLNEYLPSSAGATTVESVVHESAAAASGSASQTRLAAVWQQQANVAEQPWGRDPFAELPGLRQRPEVQPEMRTPEPPRTSPTPPQLLFSGVSRRGDRWMALLDGKIMHVGDIVGDGFEVVTIDKQSVTLGAGTWLFRYEIGVQEAVIRPRAEEP